MYLLFDCEVLPITMYIAAGTVRSHGAVIPLGCLYPVAIKIPLFKTLSLALFSTTWISRHVRVS